MTLEEYRNDFESLSNKAMSMPIAGAIVWAIIALLSTLFSDQLSLLILLFGSGAIFPIALLVARIRKENLLSNTNPLAKLMGYCVLMVNLLWAVHLPLFFYASMFVPLSLGIGLGLHWVVYSWIIQHPLGIIHASGRTALILIAWLSFPEYRVLAVSIAIVCVYCVTIYLMSSRQISSASPEYA